MCVCVCVCVCARAYQSYIVNVSVNKIYDINILTFRYYGDISNASIQIYLIDL